MPAGRAGAAARRRPSAALDRVERAVDHGVGQRPAGQPAVLLAGDQHDDRRAVVDLVLELPGQAHAAGRLGLAVEDHQVEAALVELVDDLGVGGALDPLDPRRVGRRAAADGGADLRPAPRPRLL